MKLIFRAILPILVLGLGWAGFKMLGQKEERPQRPEPPKRVIKTRVLELAKGDYQTVVRTQGVVRAHNESALTADVSGKVITISPQLTDGGLFNEGEILIELDDADYGTALIAAEAAVARAQAVLSQEVVKGKQARLNWVELGYTEEPNELVLRVPQLREAEANVKSAEAGEEQAKRDLARTKIRAPFAGRVLTKSVAVGQTVSPNTPLAMVFGSDFVEVRLPISATYMRYLTLPDSPGDKEVEVELTDTLDPEFGRTWQGRIVGTEGALDVESRELFAIARVDDPFGLKQTADDGGAPLLVGQPVAAAIKGTVLKEVVAIPRTAVRQLGRIFLVAEKDGGNVLQPHDIEPIWSDSEFYVVRDEGGELDGARVATTRLVYAPKESPVEILPDLEPDVEVEAENPETDETP